MSYVQYNTLFYSLFYVYEHDPIFCKRLGRKQVR